MIKLTIIKSFRKIIAFVFKGCNRPFYSNDIAAAGWLFFSDAEPTQRTMQLKELYAGELLAELSVGLSVGVWLTAAAHHMIMHYGGKATTNPTEFLIAVRNLFLSLPVRGNDELGSAKEATKRCTFGRSIYNDWRIAKRCLRFDAWPPQTYCIYDSSVSAPSRWDVFEQASTKKNYQTPCCIDDVERTNGKRVNLCENYLRHFLPIATF